MAKASDFAGAMRMSPIRVRTSGFVSDTLTLQRCGWEFFVEYRADYMATMMILRYRSTVAHTTFNCQQMVSEMQWDHMRPEAHSNYGFEFNFDFEQLLLSTFSWRATQHSRLGRSTRRTWKPPTQCAARTRRWSEPT